MDWILQHVFLKVCIGRTILKIKKRTMKRMHTAHEQTTSTYVMYEKTSFYWCNLLQGSCGTLLDRSPWLCLALLLLLLLLVAEAGSTCKIHPQSCMTRGYAESFGLVRLRLSSAAV
jgi:hypothetical protein